MPNKVVYKEQHIIVTVMLALLSLISPLLKDPFLPTLLSSYAFIKARAAADQITAEVQPLLPWLRGVLQDPSLVVEVMESIDLNDHLMRNRRRLLSLLGMEEPPPPVPYNTCVLQAPPVLPPPQVTSKKEFTQVERQ